MDLARQMAKGDLYVLLFLIVSGCMFLVEIWAFHFWQVNWMEKPVVTFVLGVQFMVVFEYLLLWIWFRVYFFRGSIIMSREEADRLRFVEASVQTVMVNKSLI